MSKGFIVSGRLRLQPCRTNAAMRGVPARLWILLSPFRSPLPPESTLQLGRCRKRCRIGQIHLLALRFRGGISACRV